MCCSETGLNLSQLKKMQPATRETQKSPAHATLVGRMLRKTGTFILQQFQVITCVDMESMIWLTDFV
jgi:hypothetical protein